MANARKELQKGAMEKVDSASSTPQEAMELAKELSSAKFDETVEVAVRLGVDTRKADQNIRGSISLPHGTGKTVRVAVFAEGAKATEAEEAGADIVGSDDLVALSPLATSSSTPPSPPRT